MSITLEDLRNERRQWLTWKNIAPLMEAIAQLPDTPTEVSFDDWITIRSSNDIESYDLYYQTAWALRPWRKGPFDVCSIRINSEWQSFVKYNLLSPFFDLKDKKVADIGCNNGYYMFRMLDQNPKKLVGFDPSPHNYAQFSFINHFVKSSIQFELLGVEHLPLYDDKFDVIFCLGVLYHRPDPIGTLKSLYAGLEEGGELYLDTFMIDGDEPTALCPPERYSKIPNVYFVPTVNALKGWLSRAKFKEIEVLALRPTDETEQRKTEWIEGESLSSFLDPQDITKTVEGFPAPKRLYIRAKK